MRMWQMVLYLLHFLVWFARESNSQFCNRNKQIVNFCTDNGLTDLTDVEMDAFYVPRYQKSVCQCIISFDPGAMLSVSFNDEPVLRNIVFKINENVLSSSGNVYKWTSNTANITLLTTKNYSIENVCLDVYAEDNSKFNITCMKSKNSTTISSTSSTFAGTETPTGQVTDPDPYTQPYAEDDKDTGGNKFIVPVVAAVSGVVVLVIVTVVIIVCRKRSTKKEGQSATSSSYVEKEEDNDYYMTENPMYNATDILPKAQNSDNEYHYTVHDNHGDRMSANQYESFPDSPLRKQCVAKETDKEEHYDYSTCLSNSQKCLSAVVNEQTLATKSDGTSLPNNQSADIENTYDRTDKLAKPFVGENEYHHLTPAGSRIKTALDTYHTVGSVVVNKHEQEENGEESEYHVTSLR